MRDDFQIVDEWIEMDPSLLTNPDSSAAILSAHTPSQVLSSATAIGVDDPRPVWEVDTFVTRNRRLMYNYAHARETADAARERRLGLQQDFMTHIRKRVGLRIKTIWIF